MSELAANRVTFLSAQRGTGDAATPAALSRAIARGDVRAFEAFYRLWFERAASIVHGLTRRDESFCLDVVQNSMIKAARRMPAMGTDGEVEGWMLRVLHTTALDELRSERRRRLRESAHRDRSFMEARADLDESIARVRTAIEQLEPAERGLLMMRFRGATLDQAGEADGVSGDAAHGRIRRAISRLRQGIRRDEP